MKYCLPYIKNFKYMEELDEVIIPYQTEQDAEFLRAVLEFTENKFNGTIIINIEDTTAFREAGSIKFFEELKSEKVLENFKLRFTAHYKEHEDLYKGLKAAEIPFFFEKYVKDWDAFDFFKKLGVSDMYIVETLAFELDKIGAQADVSGISIRCFANVCQSSVRDHNPLKSFFIRPEDVSIYEPYVDVIEFYGSLNIQEVMYKVYAKDKKWFGPLQEIIIGFEHDLDSRFILPIYARTRLKCGKRCLKGQRCSICEKVVDVAGTLEDKGVYVKA